jgi:hypothetical protein
MRNSIRSSPGIVSKTLRQLTSAADLLRPHTFFRTLARVDHVADETRELSEKLEQVRIRTEQLMAIERLNWEQRKDVDRLSTDLDAARIGDHVRRAVALSTLHTDPFPHVVIDEWLPPAFYDVVIRALPPAIFFADREVSRQRLLVPFPVAPAYSQRVWSFLADEIVACSLRDALAAKFEAVVREYVGTFCSIPGGFNERLQPSDGRILLRRPGYVIPPHRDPKWGFLTGLVYLARPGDNQAYGTQLYRVREDREAPNDKPLYVDERQCELVKAVPFRPNTLLVFLNSTGAHGAAIPEDATPASLERYVYQFRLGPDTAAIKRLLAAMPAEQRHRWAGAKAEKAHPT